MYINYIKKKLPEICRYDKHMKEILLKKKRIYIKNFKAYEYYTVISFFPSYFNVKLIPRSQTLIFLKMISSVLVTEIKYNVQKEER